MAAAGSQDVNEIVASAARAARAASGSLAAAPAKTIDEALRGMARRLATTPETVLEANRADVAAAEAGGMSGGLLDRLRLDEARLAAMAEQIDILADVEPEPARRTVRDLGGGLVLQEWRRPVGVIGANYEARPNVTVDVASQLVKSQNGGVLRTGSAALASATALMDEIVAPALAEAGLDPAAIQLIRARGRGSADALVAQPGLIPLVILRGSGESTRTLAEKAALQGVRTLAHADGGGVLYIDAAADLDKAFALVAAGLDRLGVCNRLNLLLIHRDHFDALVPRVEAAVAPRIALSLPPHEHALGYEWALDSDREATITLAPVDGPLHAARLANDETSGLAAGIVTEDAAAAREFLSAYAGTGAFWNATTRLLDGFKLLNVPETGINIDRVPGPRGPVTFRDLSLRQYAVVPADRVADL
ncbi:MAG TPA: aldehyde dehydrogenase family protein [Dactylosporangium sp.]|nr:aldehyde dehydrogenase family protein [Dactylosporangium sp.]